MRLTLRTLQARPLQVVRIGVGLTIGLLVLLALIGRDVYRAFGDVHAHSLKFEELVRTSSLDGQLTQAARMTAVTGDTVWAVRHDVGAHAVHEVVRLFQSRAHEVGARRTAARLSAAHAELVRIEDDVIRLALSGDREGALILLSGDEYNAYKDDFVRALAEITNAFGSDVREDQERFESRALIIALVAGLGTILLLVFWLAALGLIRGYVTEREKGETRERELLQEQVARAAAERASQTKNEFLSRMSHELRTPLNAILGFGQLLEVDDTVRDKESIEQILKGGRHLLYLIDEVLDIAKIEAGRISISMEPVSVGEVLGDALDMVRHAATDSGVALLTGDLLQNAPYVRADRQRLKQVFLNLLSNAIKYNRASGTVTVTCSEVGDHRVRIEVTDTGSGIASDRIRRLFIPFDRLDAERTGVEGTGLGLALSKGLVEAMGGEIGVVTVDGAGSTFWLELSHATPVTEMASQVLDDIPVAIGSAPEQAQMVLLVEDNLANVRLVERILGRRPQVRLLTSMQGRLGLELAREHLPDLILLDVNLPDLSGLEVLEMLQQDPVTRGLPVVMVSADAIESRVQRFLAVGARAYITKPFDVVEFLAIVDETLSPAAVEEAG